MYSKSDKRAWSWFLVILAGLIIGGFIGQYLSSFSVLSWLELGGSLGDINTPFTLNLGVLKIQFAIMLNFNICGILGMLIAPLIYRKL